MARSRKNAKRFNDQIPQDNGGPVEDSSFRQFAQQSSNAAKKTKISIAWDSFAAVIPKIRTPIQLVAFGLLAALAYANRTAFAGGNPTNILIAGFVAAAILLFAMLLFFLEKFDKRHRPWVFIVAVISIIGMFGLLLALLRPAASDRLTSLRARLSNTVDAFDWTRNQMDDLLAIKAEWDSVDKLSASTEFTKVAGDLSSRIAELINSSYLIDFEIRELERRIQLLSALDSSVANQIEPRLQSRIPSSTPLFDLTPPFANLLDVATPDLACADNEMTQLKNTTTSPIVRLKKDCKRGARFSAVFDQWFDSPAIGLILNHCRESRYYFVVRVHSAESLWKNGADLKLLGSAPKLGLEDRAVCEIRCNGLTLASSEVRLTHGPLRLVVERRGFRLIFEVNDLPLLTADDPFDKLHDTRSEVFGLYMPLPAKLLEAHGFLLNRPAIESSLEQGDMQFAMSNFRDALRLYLDAQRDPQISMNKILCLQLECKIASCLDRLDQHQDAKLRRKGIANEDVGATRIANLWAGRAATELFVNYLNDGHEEEAVTLWQDSSMDRREQIVAGSAGMGLRVDHADFLFYNAPVWRLTFKYPILPSVRVNRLQAAVGFCKAYEPTHEALVVTQWKLMHALGVNEEPLKALEVFEEILSNSKCQAEEIDACFRDMIWILLGAGLTDRAEEVLIKYRSQQRGAIDRFVIMVESARVRACKQDLAGAKNDIELCFGHLDKMQIRYSEFADACLLRGMIYRKLGNEAQASEAWLQARTLDGIPETYDANSVREASDYAIAPSVASIVLSLCWKKRDLTNAEIIGLVQKSIYFDAKSAKLGDAIPGWAGRLETREILSYVKNAIAARYTFARTQDTVCRVAFRQYGLEKYFQEQIRAMLYALVRVGIADRDMEEISWTVSGGIVSTYQTKALYLVPALAIVPIWMPALDLGHLGPMFYWNLFTTKDQFEANLRCQLCVLFGARLKAIGNRKAEMAFLKTAMTQPGVGESTQALAGRLFLEEAGPFAALMGASNLSDFLGRLSSFCDGGATGTRP